MNLKFGKMFQAVGTDKQGIHNYGGMYDQLFPEEKRLRVKSVLELGGGASSRAWCLAFPNLEVINVLDANASAVEGLVMPPAKVFQGDFGNPKDYEQVLDQRYDLIVDDGSHVVTHMLLAWHVLFPKHLNHDGVYVMEDVQSEEDLKVLEQLYGAYVFDLRASKRYDDLCVVFHMKDDHE